MLPDLVPTSSLQMQLLLWLRATLAQGLVALLRLLRPVLPVALRAPMPGDATIDRTWLEATINRSVCGPIKLTRPGDGRGFAGDMSFLRVAVMGGEDRDQEETMMSFVLKTSYDGITARRGAIESQRYREGQFYANILQGPPEGLLPRVWYSAGSALLGQYVVLMEDLMAHPTAVGANMTFGNQVWGLPKPLDPPYQPLAVLEAVFVRMAEMHARKWRDPALLHPSHNWLKGAEWYHGKDRAAWEFAIDQGRRCWAIFKHERLPTRQIMLDERLVQIIDESYTRASWDSLQAHLHDPDVPWTLCHGDLHASNMIIQPEIAGTADVEMLARGLRLFDWSEVGPWEPMTDLGQMVISDVQPSAHFVDHSRRLVRRYWDCLVIAGVKDYPFDRCYSDFCRGGPERWIWLFPILAYMPGIPDKAVQYWHDQLLAFILAHMPQPYYVLKPVCQLSYSIGL